MPLLSLLNISIVLKMGALLLVSGSTFSVHLGKEGETF